MWLRRQRRLDALYCGCLYCLLLASAGLASATPPPPSEALCFGSAVWPFCVSAVCACCRWCTGLVGDKLSGISSICSGAGEVVDSGWLHHLTIVILCGSQSAVALVPHSCRSRTVWSYNFSVHTYHLFVTNAACLKHLGLAGRHGLRRLYGWMFLHLVRSFIG